MTEFLCIMNSTFASKILFEVNEMLKLSEDQLTLWDAILPEPFRSLPEELAKIDALLDDPAFMKPFIEKHPSQRGRPNHSGRNVSAFDGSEISLQPGI